MTTAATALDRSALSDWYRRIRQRSRQLFDLVQPEAYFSRPIALRHPIVFYEGHLPAFSVNTLVKKVSDVLASTRRYERLFARAHRCRGQGRSQPHRRTEIADKDKIALCRCRSDALVLIGWPTAGAGRASTCTRAQAVHHPGTAANHHQKQCSMRVSLDHERAPAAPADVTSATRHGRMMVQPPRDTRCQLQRDPLRLGRPVPAPSSDYSVGIDVHNVTNNNPGISSKPQRLSGGFSAPSTSPGCGRT